MDADKTTPVFVLTLKPVPTDEPNWTPERRLRLALKALLRKYGLRCVDARLKDAAEPLTVAELLEETATQG